MNLGRANPSTVIRRRLVVRGQVQGVGFRPFVYRLADELAVGGFVRNDGTGVTIELQGAPTALDTFVRRLRADLPPVARIDHLDEQAIEPAPGDGQFRILLSDHSQPAQADVAFDLATCDDCLGELFDPADRRFGYPFINCTNCGPRYSIVRDVPYDRPMTTMSVFTMCPACQGEYDDPHNRRFHAQPNACPVCGPQVWLTAPNGKRVEPSIRNPKSEIRNGTEQVVAAAAAALLEGKIVAIRGVGGFHLAVRADRDDAVARLRERKGREHKPLALMVRSLADAERLIELTGPARDILLGPQRPIVIARRRAEAPVSRHVAPGADTLGVMLPYAPLQHLLFAEMDRQLHACGESHFGFRISNFGLNSREPGLPTRPRPRTIRNPKSEIRNCIPLVMTSGNIADEPILAGNEEALAGLGRVADLFLLHNREIDRRIDDSVVEAVGQGVLPLRRARGYVPAGVDLPVGPVEHGLAVGGELKNTVAIVRTRGLSTQAILSEHVGDLKDGRVYRHFERVIAHLLQITHTTPAWIAHDLHPMYLSTSWARRQGLRLIGVQHHHAHVASCLAEHGRAGPAIGVAGDGVGYGDDGTIWGGEILIADLAGFRRVGHVRAIALPGGDAAAVRTARPAVAWLFDATAGSVPARWLDRLLPRRSERDLVLKQLAEGFNCPPSSALGRYFDAAAAILGIALANRFEAEAPIALESAIEPGCDETLPFRISDFGFRIDRSDASTRLLEGPQVGASRDAADCGVASNPKSEIRNPRFEIDLRPTVLELVRRAESNEPVGRLAAAFHNTVAAALAAGVDRACELSGLRTVAASGGVFCNRYLAVRLAELLTQERSYEFLTHRQVPANDGGLAFGQAAVAAARVAGMNSAAMRNAECEMRNAEFGIRD